MEKNLHSPERELIELGMAHADLDALIDLAAGASPTGERMMRRVEKRILAPRVAMASLHFQLAPNEPA